MAGVGFELRKLFNAKGIIARLGAYAVSSFVTVGPMALCIISIVSMQLMMSSIGTDYSERELFLCCIIYAFAFSLIFTGGISMLASRYLSDLLYQKKPDKIANSFYGFVSITAVLAMVTGCIFLLRGNVDGKILFLTLLIYLQLSIIWIEAVYLSVVKDYLTIALTFFGGTSVIVLFVIVLLRFSGLSAILSMLISINIGYFIMLMLFAGKIQITFGKGSFLFKDCFEFLKNIDGYPELLLIGFFYYLGMYGHNFTFWLGDRGILIADIFLYLPLYDLPVFYAFLTILPAIVIFVVKIETSFYGSYREYYSMVCGRGSIKDIKIAKEEMITTLFTELKYIMELQLFISIVALILGSKVLPQLGLSMQSVDIYSILVLGSYAFIVMYIICLLLLYFDDRKGTISITMIFVVSSVLLSIVSQVIGENFYGYGFFYGALTSMIAALLRLNWLVKNLDYYTFSSQPLIISRKRRFFEGLYGRLCQLSGGKYD